jgi:hypothetical protein
MLRDSELAFFDDLFAVNPTLADNIAAVTGGNATLYRDDPCSIQSKSNDLSVDCDTCDDAPQSSNATLCVDMLSLSALNISVLPLSVGNLTECGILSMPFNVIQELPLTLMNIGSSPTSREYKYKERFWLNMTGNRLQFWRSEAGVLNFSSHFEIIRIDVSDNKLDALPDFVAPLLANGPTRFNLRAAGNVLKAMPSLQVSAMTVDLDFSRNPQMVAVSDSVLLHARTLTFDVSNNIGLSNASSLERFCSWNVTVDSCVYDATDPCMSLSFNYINLTSWHPCLSTAFASDCRFPENMYRDNSRVYDVVHLYAENNALTDVDASLDLMSCLTLVDFSLNRIREWPAVLNARNFPFVEDVRMVYNDLSALPMADPFGDVGKWVSKSLFGNHFVCPLPSWAPASLRCHGCVDGFYNPPLCNKMCEPGFACKNGTRTACVAGTFASASGAPLCLPCNDTSVSTTASSVQCAVCPEGTLADTRDHSRCLPCESAGLFCGMASIGAISLPWLNGVEQSSDSSWADLAALLQARSTETAIAPLRLLAAPTIDEAVEVGALDPLAISVGVGGAVVVAITVIAFGLVSRLRHFLPRVDLFGRFGWVGSVPGQVSERGSMRGGLWTLLTAICAVCLSIYVAHIQYSDVVVDWSVVVEQGSSMSLTDRHAMSLFVHILGASISCADLCKRLSADRAGIYSRGVTAAGVLECQPVHDSCCRISWIVSGDVLFTSSSRITLNVVGPMSFVGLLWRFESQSFDPRVNYNLSQALAAPLQTRFEGDSPTVVSLAIGTVQWQNDLLGMASTGPMVRHVGTGVGSVSTENASLPSGTSIRIELSKQPDVQRVRISRKSSSWRELIVVVQAIVLGAFLSLSRVLYSVINVIVALVQMAQKRWSKSRRTGSDDEEMLLPTDVDANS